MTIKNLIRKSEANTKNNKLLKRGFVGPLFNSRDLAESFLLLFTQKMSILRKAIYNTDSFGDLFYQNRVEEEVFSYYYKWTNAPISFFQKGIHAVELASEDRLALRTFEQTLPYFLINFKSTLNILIISDAPLTLSDNKIYYTEVQGGVFKAVHDNGHFRFIDAIKECIDDLCDYQLKMNTCSETGYDPVSFSTCEKVGDFYQHHLALDWYSCLRVECENKAKRKVTEESFSAFGKDAELIKSYQEWADSIK